MEAGDPGLQPPPAARQRPVEVRLGHRMNREGSWPSFMAAPGLLPECSVGRDATHQPFGGAMNSPRSLSLVTGTGSLAVPRLLGGSTSDHSCQLGGAGPSLSIMLLCCVALSRASAMS